MCPREPMNDTIASASAIAASAARKRPAKISNTLTRSSAIGSVVIVRARRSNATHDRVTACPAVFGLLGGDVAPNRLDLVVPALLHVVEPRGDLAAVLFGGPA
jgi:hypothetical protein